jgi:immune inhibitor A
MPAPIHSPARQIRPADAVAVWSDFCAVAPSPELIERLRAELERVRSETVVPLSNQLAFGRNPRMLGFDDGVIFPPEEFPVGTLYSTIRNAAAERAPLRGSVNVIVVLVDFSDRSMTQTTAHFDDLFFSTGVLPHGSVKEYYHEVTGGLVDIVGQTVGPLRLPQTLAWYANNNFGIGRPSGTARANIMARDAANAADATVDFAPYDNDGNGYVDAFIVVHAGPDGAATGNPGDIWSHKWTLPSVYSADGTNIYGYLTIPEDAKIGVCAHELGHLLFGFPDLYDTDDTSEGVGNWCLMGAGSWGGGGDVPTHPSAWCKANQGWASVTNVTSSGSLTISDVKSSRNLHRLWKDGTSGPEYFLLENRQRTGYDASLPGDGLLVWHVDENQPGNTDENHYRVGLVEADAQRDLELAHNRGDGGDPYPGSSTNTSLTSASTPNSKSYAGQDTCVSVTNISASGPTMSATVLVSCAKAQTKDLKDDKEQFKERKDVKDDRDGGGKTPLKDFRDAGGGKTRLKDLLDGGGPKGLLKDLRDGGGGKNPIKDAKDIREGKGPKDLVERPGGRGRGELFGQGGGQAAGGQGGGAPLFDALAELDARIGALEEVVWSATSSGSAEPFIGSELRPDLLGGPAYPGAGPSLEERMVAGDATAKRHFDTLPPQ